MRVDESNYDALHKVSQITHVDYEIIWKDAENIEGYIDANGLFCMIEDLLYELDVQKEKYDDLLEDLRDNYRPIPYSEQVCVSDRDFI